jgi:septal ring factor EnvC (AmiA/AmiB activator)
MEVMQTFDTRSELAKLEDELRAALIENERLHAQICELQVTFGQVKTRLRDFQDLLDAAKDLADDILADSE